MTRKQCHPLIVSALVLIVGCTSVSRNDLENKIEGKWHQAGGVGGLAGVTSLFDYTFTGNKEFVREISVPSDQKVVYKNWPAQKGTFQIKNDSLYFYHEGNPEEAFYSAKIVFQNDRKFILLDENGELDYERKN